MEETPNTDFVHSATFPDQQRFVDRVAVVTGAAAGIGRAAAVLLAGEGAKVVGVDRDEAGLRSLEEEFGGVTTVVADVSVEDEVVGYLRRALELHGRIDLFFNNAGILGPFGPIMDVATEDFDRVMAINARAMFLGLREVMKVMRDQGTGGSIVNTASMVVITARGDCSPYIASKGAVAGLSAAATWDGAPYGIRVNALAPGLIDTQMTRIPGTSRAGSPEEMSRRVPAGRYGQPEEVARAVLWLLSDEASYVNGSLHVIDGGLNA